MALMVAFLLVVSARSSGSSTQGLQPSDGSARIRMAEDKGAGYHTHRTLRVCEWLDRVVTDPAVEDGDVEHQIEGSPVNGAPRQCSLSQAH
jgi:hypothetical protein